MCGRRLFKIVGVLSLAILGVCRAHAAPDIQKLVGETQRSIQAGDHLAMVWWIPQEFWNASLSSNPNVTDDARTQLLNALEEYQVFVLVYAKTGVAGFTDVQSKKELIEHSKFVVAGRAVDAIDADKISPAAQTVLASMKPALAGMLGSLGQAMQLVVYPSKSDGRRIADPLLPGGFEYMLYDQRFSWRLPLASLLPNKIDPKTQDEFPGDYAFNPYTGTKLVLKPEKDAKPEKN